MDKRHKERRSWGDFLPNHIKMEIQTDQKYILQSLLQANQNNLVRNIDTIKFRIAERAKLKQQTQKELERQKGKIEDLITQFSYPYGSNPNVVASLTTKMVQTSQEIAMQEIESFRDISDLEKELREEEKLLREEQSLNIKNDQRIAR